MIVDDAVDAIEQNFLATGYTKGGPKMTAAAEKWFSKMMKAVAENAAANPSFWNQSVNPGPGAITVKMIKDVQRQYQAGRSLHASNTVVKTVPRFDAFGTDYTTVDRMANPYRPGTAPHGQWMRDWVEAQYHWKTDQFKAHYAEVTEAREAMIESCAPVANWVDEVLFEVAEARDECEDVEEFEGYEPVGAFVDEGWHLTPIIDKVLDFQCTFDGPTHSSVGEQVWHIMMSRKFWSS